MTINDTEYIYFVSYCYMKSTKTPGIIGAVQETGHGNTKITILAPITTWEQIEGIEKAIVDLINCDTVILLNYKLLQQVSRIEETQL